MEQFSSVSPGEIAMAEQSLIKSGVPLKEVQRLCDVHSALFHGKTEQELIESRLAAASEESTSTGYSALPAGHPISIMLAENKGLVDFLDELENTASNPSRCAAVFPRIMALFSECFRAIPLGAILEKKVLILHGGLFKQDGVTLNDIQHIDRFTDCMSGGSFIGDD